MGCPQRGVSFRPLPFALHAIPSAHPHLRRAHRSEASQPVPSRWGLPTRFQLGTRRLSRASPALGPPRRPPPFRLGRRTDCAPSASFCRAGRPKPPHGVPAETPPRPLSRPPAASASSDAGLREPRSGPAASWCHRQAAGECLAPVAQGIDADVGPPTPCSRHSPTRSALPGARTAAWLGGAVVAATTSGSYQGKWLRFVRFCRAGGVSALPAAASTVCAWAACRLAFAHARTRWYRWRVSSAVPSPHSPPTRSV